MALPNLVTKYKLQHNSNDQGMEKILILPNLLILWCFSEMRISVAFFHTKQQHLAQPFPKLQCEMRTNGSNSCIQTWSCQWMLPDKLELPLPTVHISASQQCEQAGSRKKWCGVFLINICRLGDCVYLQLELEKWERSLHPVWIVNM